MATLSASLLPELTFVASPKADLVIQSSDNVTFPVRRLYLQAASEVFEDMFSTGTDAEAEKDHDTGLPIVKLQDKASELDVFLRFIDRDQNRLGAEGRPLNPDETMSLIHLADKYGVKTLLDAVDLSSLRAIVATDPPKIFGFAMSHGLIETARDALALFQRRFYLYRNPREFQGKMSGGPPHLLHDVPKGDLARIPFDVLYELGKAQERVLLHGSTWDEEAKEIKLT